MSNPNKSHYFKNRNTNKRGKNRELYFTPDKVIEQIVDDLLIAHPDLKERVWVDPCAADGRWEKYITSKGIKCKSYDLFPLNNSVIQQDFLNDTCDALKDCFIIGNPPFSLLKQFVNKALTLTDKCYFLGGSQIITGKLAEKVETLHCFEEFEGKQKDHRSKIAFIDTLNNELLIWCCGAVFTNTTHPTFIRGTILTSTNFRVGVTTLCEKDTRVRIIYENK